MDLLLGVVEVGLGSESVGDDGVLVVDLGSQLLTTYRAYVSLPHIAKKLYLPLLAIPGDSSENRASLAFGVLDFVLAPEDDGLGVRDRSQLSHQLLLLRLQHLFYKHNVIVGRVVGVEAVAEVVK